MARERAMNYLQIEKERFESIRKSAEERLREAPEGTVYIRQVVRSQSMTFFRCAENGFMAAEANELECRIDDITVEKKL